MLDPYDPETWHDFFLASAGAAAALTGLLFIGLSLHVRYIASSSRHRNMARGSLIGLVLVLVISLVALLPQAESWAGGELVVVNLFYIVAVGAAAGMFGGIGLYFHFGGGLYVVALQVVAIVIWNLQNAWLLLMGVADEDMAKTLKS